MATTSAGNPYVESSDLVANYPATSLALANRLDKYAVNPFANATARDAAIPTPVQGQLAQTLDDNKVWRYDGSTWAPFSGAPGGASFTNTPTGTYTNAGIDYKYITYTGTGNFEIDVAGLATVLIVGPGGGGGGSSSGDSGGGGGGGQVTEGNIYFEVGTYAISIPAGGAGSTDGLATSGGVTVIGELLLATGGGAAGGRYQSGLAGSSGGGAGSYNDLTGYRLGGSAFSYITGYDGSGGGSWFGGSGGGGGAGSAALEIAGGSGKSSSITNVATMFGAGGIGNVATAGPPNSGNGGGGVPSFGTGANGGSGSVTVRIVV